MITKPVLFITIATILFLSGCAPKQSFDLKMTIEPLSGIYTEKIFNFGETGNIITKRLINLGIDSENIDLRTFTDKMILTVVKIDTAKTEIIEKLITIPGKIEFWETYENSEILPFLLQANIRLGEMKVNVANVIEEKTKETITVDTSLKEKSEITDLINADTTGDASAKEYKINNPLFAILIPRVDANSQPLPSCLIGLVALKDTAKVNRYMGMKELKYIFPRDLRFYWSHSPYKYDETQTLFELHAIKATSLLGNAPLSGDVIVSAKAITSKNGPDVRLDLSMNHEGAMKWGNITKENINRCIAVVIDGYVRSYPRVMNEITSGNTEITGNFSLAEARYLSAILSSGSEIPPFKLQVTGKQVLQHK
jgi:SecD/SecF fusion protein